MKITAIEILKGNEKVRDVIIIFNKLGHKIEIEISEAQRKEINRMQDEEDVLELER